MRELLSAVVVLDHRRSDGRTLSRRAGAADELLGGQQAATGLRRTTYSLEQRRGPTRAAWALECAHGTDKALGESQLSRPLARATATPSTRMCAPPMCRHLRTSALTRMLACHIWLCLGRWWDHSKDSCMSLLHL